MRVAEISVALYKKSRRKGKRKRDSRIEVSDSKKWRKMKEEKKVEKKGDKKRKMKKKS